MQLTIDPAQLRCFRLWILTPAYGGQSYVAHNTSVLQLCLRLQALKIEATLRYLPNDSLVPRARNNLADMFIHSGWDHPDNDLTLWLDGDVTFQVDDVLAMLSLMLNPKYDILAAPYTRKGLHMDRMAAAARLGWDSERMKQVAGDPNVNYVTANMSLTEPSPLLESGTGFILNRRKVYSQMQAAHPERLYKRTPDEASIYGRPEAFDYFPVGIDPETRQYLSEDWWFCRTWLRMGGTIYGCMWIKTGHIGTMIYEMNMPAIAELLNATGGFLHGPTELKETKDATSNRIPAGTTRSETGGGNGVRPDISRALAFVQRETLQATFPAKSGHPGSLGWGDSYEGGFGESLSNSAH